MGDVVERLKSIEKSLPNFFVNVSQINESIESINKRTLVLESSNTHDNRDLRIGKLEEAMETLNSTFSSLGFKKEKAFVGKEQKFMYVPKGTKLKSHGMLKVDKTFSEVKNVLHVESSSRVPKVPIITSCVLEKVIDLNAPSFENT